MTASARTRMRRIGWILVKGEEMAASIWTDKEEAEKQARVWGSAFSVRPIYAPSGDPSPRAITGNSPAEGRRQ